MDLAQARERMKSLNNLHQLALAMINYADTYRHLPPPAIYSGQETGDAGGQSNDSRVQGGRPAVGTAEAPMGLGGKATGLNVRKQVLPVLKGRAMLSWRVMLL